MNLLEIKTQRVNIEGVQRYATPLLRKTGAPKLNSSPHSVMAHLRATEKWLKKDLQKAALYSSEIGELIQAGSDSCLRTDRSFGSAGETYTVKIQPDVYEWQRGWDDPDIPAVLRHDWEAWENELQHLSRVSIPCCYSPFSVEGADPEYDLHIFCDASKRAYGAVAYLTVPVRDIIHTSFVMARSRVAPKRQQSMPCMELCAAVAGAQLAKLVETELTLTIQQTTLWSDSTIVLEWLQSDSC
eukprot:superscaffoldBa00000742_g6927